MSEPTRASTVPAEYLQPNGKYKPGHDARHAGVIARRILATGDATHINELPTDALRIKAINLVELWQAKAEEKAAKAKAREDAKAARDAEKEAAALARAETKMEQAKEPSTEAPRLLSIVDNPDLQAEVEALSPKDAEETEDEGEGEAEAEKPKRARRNRK